MSLVLQDQLVLSPATAEHLQEEIDTIEAGSDVTDVVGTYADLQAYDTSTLTDKDVIKVLDDETEDHAQTYYRWSASSRSFSYVGKVESKTYTAGNGVDITNDVISVANPVVINKSTLSTNLYIDPEMTISQPNGARAVGILATATGNNSVCIGDNAKSMASASVSIGFSAQSNNTNATHSVSLGSYACAKATHSIQIGSTGSFTGNNDANTFKVANTNGNFEIMSADGTIPEARLADTTSATEGQVLQLDSNNNAIWADVDGLPDQTGQTGKVLTTDGTDASWESPVVATFRAWGANE